MDHYRQALRINGDYASAHNNLGCLLAKNKNIGEAVEHFERASTIDPGNEEFRRNLDLGQKLFAQSGWR